MSEETELIEWRGRRSPDQRDSLKRAAEQRILYADATRLLLGTRCPVGPVGTKWEYEPEYQWSWAEAVRTFVLQQ